MSWNYRIVRHRKDDETWYSLHEVYYDGDDNPTSMTSEPCTFGCDDNEGPEGIQASLHRALTDANCRPVLDNPWQK